LPNVEVTATVKTSLRRFARIYGVRSDPV